MKIRYNPELRQGLNCEPLPQKQTTLPLHYTALEDQNFVVTNN